MSIVSVMPSNYLILCHPLLLSPSIFPSIRVFSNESALCIMWPKYWNFSISPSNEYSGLISFRMDWCISLQSKWLSRVFSNNTVQKHQFFSTQLSLQSNSHIHQFSSVQSLSHVWLFVMTMDCSTSGIPVHHQLSEFTQIHVHQVSDAIQPSHPLSSPSPLTFNLSQHRGLSQWVSSSS